jgi:alpha-L-fucosidase
VRKVTMLADGKTVPWTQEMDGLRLTLPVKPVGRYAYVLRLEK